jgi:hypothetical protein
MKKYKFSTSGLNKKGQRTGIFECEFYAKNRKELDKEILALQEQYYNQEKELDYISYTINEILFIESNTVQY